MLLAGARGRSMLKQLPAPAALVTAICPPWAAMMARLMYKPRPVPDGA